MGDGGKHRPFMPAKPSCFQPLLGSTRSMAYVYVMCMRDAALVATVVICDRNFAKLA